MYTEKSNPRKSLGKGKPVWCLLKGSLMMASLGKRRYDFYAQNYEAVLLAEAVHIPTMDFHPHGIPINKKNKKKNKNKNRNKRQFQDDNPKRPKLSNPKDDEYIVGRIIGNMNKPSNTSAFQDCLMMSEWLREIPEDFEDNWIMVPCPRGKRMLVVAGSECTRCYTKSGDLMFYFNTSLPGGHAVAGDEESRKITVLDCIWHHKDQTYYVLDGIVWNSTHLLDCQADFRFFWLQQKLLETEFISKQSEENDYPFVFLPRFPCKKDDLTNRMINCLFPQVFLESVDGFLFYEKNATYFNGISSNVRWLKPFMVPDVLEMPVAPELLLDCPNDCLSTGKYIEEFEENKKCVLKKEKVQRRLRYLEELGEVTVKEEVSDKEELKEVTVKEGVSDKEDLREVTVKEGVSDEEDFREVTVKEGVSDKEELSQVKVKVEKDLLIKVEDNE